MRINEEVLAYPPAEGEEGADGEGGGEGGEGAPTKRRRPIEEPAPN